MMEFKSNTPKYSYKILGSSCTFLSVGIFDKGFYRGDIAGSFFKKVYSEAVKYL